MKSFKKLALLGVCGILAVLPAGCNTKNYTFYTNLPEDAFVLTDNTFQLGGIIGGYAPEDRQFEEIDTANYTLRGKEQYYVMGADYQLVVGADFTMDGEADKFNTFNHAIYNEINAIDNAISSTVSVSDIYKFNNAEAGTTMEISKVTYEVLSIAQYVYTFTECYYNPALYYNINVYGFGASTEYPKTFADLPDDKIIEKYTDLASHFGEVKLSVEEGEDGDKYFVTKPQYTVEVEGEALSLKLDLGGIGKGYAVDRVDELFEEYGYKFGYFNFGTSSMLVKAKLDNSAWDIELINPRALSDTFLTVTARNEKLSTSGDDSKRYFIDGVRYCHIIDPTTGKPVQTGIMSATVIGGSAAEDDALTTAIMAMGKERAVTFIENKLKDRKVVFACE